MPKQTAGLLLHRRRRADIEIFLVHPGGPFWAKKDIAGWSIPKGEFTTGEDPLQAAQRELKEETGLGARHWQLLGRAHLSNSVSDEEALYYLATDLVPGDAEPEGTEKLQLRRVAWAEALQMALTGEITDALSLLALLRYALMKAEEKTVIG